MCVARGGCGYGGPTRSLTAHRGPRARGGQREAADRGQLDPVAAEVAPTWRLHGCHAGRREVDDDVGRNGRRTAAASGGANHGDTGESEHTGRLHGTRGNEPTARIRRGMLDGGRLRRRQPAAREGGNGDGATGDRFGRARASTRLREFVPSVGLGGATPSEAGDERALRSTGGDGGEHTASGGNGRGGAS
uniref:Circumsporozoite protein-like n=1 Tax=Oryza sativa subsp. japonica TaxID=39947 RepID=Q6Z7S7_ORYSJ|nr:circumsporozoite protein-like [Oryza sativa Japonica Group]